MECGFGGLWGVLQFRAMRLSKDGKLIIGITLVFALIVLAYIGFLLKQVKIKHSYGPTAGNQMAP
jgi:hypothetical protein